MSLFERIIQQSGEKEVNKLSEKETQEVVVAEPSPPVIAYESKSYEVTIFPFANAVEIADWENQVETFFSGEEAREFLSLLKKTPAKDKDELCASAFVDPINSVAEELDSIDLSEDNEELLEELAEIDSLKDESDLELSEDGEALLEKDDSALDWKPRNLVRGTMRELGFRTHNTLAVNKQIRRQNKEKLLAKAKGLKIYEPWMEKAGIKALKQAVRNALVRKYDFGP